MASALEEMPLFPLETVLFPHAALQLHIFEDRYREMVRLCIEGDRPFGIVLIRSGQATGGPAEPYMVGTAVRIREVHPHNDGRMDIHVEGERRFRIRKLDFSRPYLVGFVEPVFEEDYEPSVDSEQLVATAQSGFQSLVAGILSRPKEAVQVVFPPDPTILSFAIANLLPIENLAKQRLLETTSTVDRLHALIPPLQEQLDQLNENDEMYQAIATARVAKITSEDLREWSGPN